MDHIHLDDLVIQNCVYHLDFVTRIALAPVSRYFMRASQFANKENKISLNIWHDNLASRLAQEPVVGLFHIILESGLKCAYWSIKIFNNASGPYLYSEFLNEFCHTSSAVNKERKGNDGEEIRNSINDIILIFHQIFSRFKHFKRIKFLPCSEWVRLSIDIMLNTISVEDFQPISVKKLIYSTGGQNGSRSNSSFQIDERDCKLIETVAPTLEEFIFLVGEFPPEGSDLSKRFWTAMSLCQCLKKLFLSRTSRMPYIILNSDMSDCLKSLNISEFHAFENIALKADWLFDSFKNSTSLRKLYINDVSETLGDLANPAVLPIIARLRSVEITFIAYHNEAVIRQNPNILQILRALPEKGYLNVEDIICMNPEQATPAEADAEAVKALSFWIRLSNETKKGVRLYGRYLLDRGHQRESVAYSEQAIEDLSKQEDFAGIRIERHGIRTIFQFNNARITLYNKLLDFKPYLTNAYIGNHHVA